MMKLLKSKRDEGYFNIVIVILVVVMVLSLIMVVAPITVVQKATAYYDGWLMFTFQNRAEITT